MNRTIEDLEKQKDEDNFKTKILEMIKESASEHERKMSEYLNGDYENDSILVRSQRKRILQARIDQCYVLYKQACCDVDFIKRISK